MYNHVIYLGPEFVLNCLYVYCIVYQVHEYQSMTNCVVYILGEPFSGEFTLIVSPTTSVTVTARNCLGQTAQVMVLVHVCTAVALVFIQVLYMYMYMCPCSRQ